jgi:ABC-type sugar transport system substrate-binding protein
MKARLSIAVALALVLTVAMIAVGTIAVAPKSSGPYVVATANYAVATAAAVPCPDTQCRFPGTTDTRCKNHVAGYWCSVDLNTGECYALLCAHL